MDQVYLLYLQLYLNSGDRDGPTFRGFVDNWFAYHFGGPFLNRNGRPKWFNNPDPVKQREALLNMHFISSEAKRTIDGKASDRLIKDHSIPIAVLRERLRTLNDHQPETIEAFLKSNYRLGVLTLAEDKRLTERGLKSSMPSDWNGIDTYARYHQVGISD